MEIENNTEQEPVNVQPANTEVEAQKEEPKKVQTETTKKYFKSFETEDDWKNYEAVIESRMMKDFGVDSKKALQDTISNYQTQLTSLQTEINSIKEANALINVEDDYKEDVSDLAKSRQLRKPDLSFEDAVKEVLSKNPTWAKGVKPEKLGGEKVDNGKTENVDGVYNALALDPKVKWELEHMK